MFQNISKLLSRQNIVTNATKTFSKRSFFLNQNKCQIKYPVLTKPLQSIFIHSTRKLFKDKKTLSDSSKILSAQASSSDTSSTTSQHDPNSRLLIAFTCKVCSFRSTKTMTKHAYNHGVVIIQCSSCNNRHLIADNLGWFRDGKVTIEDLMYEQGEKVLKFVMNTKPDVFEWCPDNIEKEKKKLKELKKSRNRKELNLGLDEVESDRNN
ncbi:hypothetical protein RclHR1_01670020 [Rhizophagus clarus]|uniref:Zf-DNL-domain-containing protein n=1 Tax=Rhizophagus clarus TaxID=94130 RepID=A0A2Z6QVJ0_9GLOM|nr:hypothetical protein RclHR1_01670020 [Rhizophagus clarus]GES96059.1 zf-DNL-domain-containing protein [Rhizophagus clarus]